MGDDPGSAPGAVAIVMPLAEQRGGAEMMLVRLLRANRRGPGCDYRVLFLEHGPMVREVEALGYATSVVDAGRLRDGALYLRTVRALARWLRATEARAVLSWMPKAHLYAGPAAWSAGVPALWFQHMIPSGHWMERLATRIPAAGVLCCSEGAARAQRRLGPHRPAAVVYPAVDLEAFAPRPQPPDELRRGLGLPPGRPIIGIAARLQRWKGLDVFVDAARLVRGTHPGAYFVVVGGEHALEPGYLDLLRRRVAAAGLTEHLLFAGYRADMPEWFGAMDVVVHASTEPEPFGMVIIEAMALGKPVVATRCGGPTEIITDGENGLLVPPGDADALARALVGLLEAPGERAALGEAARRRAREFDSSRLASAVAASVAEVAAYRPLRQASPVST